ncbi:hypothetical protein DFJ73DRAFT_870839 [Zopfochytrium polystomum]|nr:hypothetical protein DFJ73DRAFT_870839 [Zopfochytrium polystomum]
MEFASLKRIFVSLRSLDAACLAPPLRLLSPHRAGFQPLRAPPLATPPLLVYFFFLHRPMLFVDENGDWKMEPDDDDDDDDDDGDDYNISDDSDCCDYLIRDSHAGDGGDGFDHTPFLANLPKDYPTLDKLFLHLHDRIAFNASNDAVVFRSPPSTTLHPPSMSPRMAVPLAIASAQSASQIVAFQPFVASTIAAHLPGPDRYSFATLCRLPKVQAHALYSIPAATLEAASARGLVDLLEHRTRYARGGRVGSIVDAVDGVNRRNGDDEVNAPPPSLAWILRSREIPRSNGPPLRLEWWEECGVNAYADDQTTRALAVAAKNGHIAVLEWWKGTGWVHLPEHRDFSVCVAALAGRLPVLEWWRENCEAFNLYWEATEAASRNGHVHVLDWIHKQLADQKAKHDIYIKGMRQNGIYAACEGGHVAALDWWRGKGGKRHQFGRGALKAARFGFVDVLQWCYDHSITFPSRLMAEGASQSGQVAILQWLKEHEMLSSGDERCFCSAAFKGHGNVIRWLQSHFGESYQWDWTSTILELACKEGHVAVLELFWETISESDMGQWKDEYLVEAAANGQIKIFRFWHSKRHAETLPEEVFEAATAGRHLALLEWLKEAGFVGSLSNVGLSKLLSGPSDSDRVATKAAVLQWWRASGFRFEFDPSAVVFLSKTNRALLDWWQHSGLQVEWPEMVVDEICQCRTFEDVAALQWWKESGRNVKWRSEGKSLADHLSAYIPRCQRGLSDRYSIERRIKVTKAVTALEWWLSSGLDVESDYTGWTRYGGWGLGVWDRWWAEQARRRASK